MNTLILTSYPDFYYNDEFGNIHPQNFGNKNGFLDCLKENINKFDKFLFIASNENDYEITDLYAESCFKSFDLTLPFKRYNVLDGRNVSKAESLVSKADFIFICGGHVPTQNKFFNKINLRELLKSTSAVICGGSAGSMNMADNVYCPPELPGEALDASFKRHFKGLGFTDINILPHFNDERDLILDNKKYLDDIIIPDSFNTNILAINDGSYVVIRGSDIEVFGEAYIIIKGEVSQICTDDNSVVFIN